MDLGREALVAGFEALAESHEMDVHLSFAEDRKRMGIMVSKYDHCLYDLFLRHRYGEITADIAVVVSNHPDLQSASADFGVPFYHIPVPKGEREEAERRAIETFEQYDVDFIVLARYMQILSPLLVDAYRNRIINVHHGFLPAFKGARPYHQAYERGVKLIGATSHYVTEDLDEGPIIEQDIIRVSHRDQLDDLIQRGRDLEKVVLSRAVRWHVESRILLYANKTVIFD
jgi:formyltetrahydrofolate deformylase